MAAGCSAESHVNRIVVPILPGDRPAALNAVYFLSSCTPCNSVVVAELAEWIRTDADRATLTIVANELAPSAAETYAPLFGEGSPVRFVTDRKGSLAKQSEIAALPFLIVFDKRAAAAESRGDLASAGGLFTTAP